VTDELPPQKCQASTGIVNGIQDKNRTLATKPRKVQQKAPVKHQLSRGSFVETAGIEPASEKRTTPGTTGIFAG